MADDDKGPDFAAGVSTSSAPDGGILAGHVGEDDVLLFRRGNAAYAVGASCTHLGAPLAEGLVDGTRILCPWHHACFDLCTGEPLEAPAFDALQRWDVEIRDGRVFVTGKASSAGGLARAADARTFIIVGGGAAGFAAADQLRRAGFGGKIVVVSAERDEPYDRTLLTKDYLDGSFGDDDLPIAEHDLASLDVDFEAGVRAVRIDPAAHRVHLEDGRSLEYAKLLLATGAEPVRPKISGIERPNVHLLRSLADCRAVLDKAEEGARVVVLGGSFIALEAAAALCDRKLDVTIVCQEDAPLARIFGPQIAAEVRKVHEKHGNRFELGHTIASIDSTGVTLDDGRTIPCDFVVVGAGVRPRVELAEAAGIAVEDGIVVDPLLQTSATDIFAVGDIASWPDPYTASRIRVEHWVVAERQGQTAALNMLGKGELYDDVPFFWTKHFDFSVRYIGHAKEWDHIEVDGNLADADATVRFVKGGRVLAVATVGRDVACLREKLAMSRGEGRAPRG